MGNCNKKSGGAEAKKFASSNGGPPAPSGKGSLLPPPIDDVVTSVSALGDSHFATSGVDGWVYFYDWHKVDLVGKFRAHKKATNQVLPIGRRRVLTASNDATVRLWCGDEDGQGLLPSAASSDTGSSPATPAMAYVGHDISVVALEILDGSTVDNSGGTLLVSGSRDCSLRSWDLESGKEISRRKVLRNVVTPHCLRRLPSSMSSLVQASEDLQFRLWDLRIGGNVPAHAVHAGPDQLVCMDVSDDGNYVACGSKGFSRENCVVKVFDLRTGLRELHSAPCADQTIEALSIVAADRCLIAGKDCFLRSVELPEVRIATERSGSQANKAYTAMGVCRRPGGLGPVVLTAASDENGVGLELLAFPDASLSQPPLMLASSA